MRLKIAAISIAVCSATFCATVVKADIIGPFTAQATGTASFVGDQIDKPNLTVNAQNPMEMNLQTLDMVIDLDPPASPQTFLGSFTLIGTDGSLFADIVSGVIFGLNTSFATAAGEFVITGGTGIFEGLTGFGSFNAFTNTETGDTQIKIGGELLPAPGAMALLAIAGVFGSRRRRSMN